MLKRLENLALTNDLDDLDKLILKELQKDAKTSLRSVATKSKHSVSTVKSHLDGLIKSHVIENFIAVVNCKHIGYNEILQLFIQVLPSSNLKHIIEKIKKIKSINIIYQVSGDYPIFCIAKCFGKPEQIKMIEEINKIHGIYRIRTQIVLQSVKEDLRVEIV